LWREFPVDLRTGDPQTEGIPAGDAAAASCDSIYGHHCRGIGKLTAAFIPGQLARFYHIGPDSIRLIPFQAERLSAPTGAIESKLA